MVGGRALSLGSVAVLAALSIGFGAWSAATNPNVAAEQLHQAAANLFAASSFVTVVDTSESVVGTSEVIQITRTIDYEAPNRQHERATVAVAGRVSVQTFTQVGSSCWSYVTGRVAEPLACLRNAFASSPLFATASDVTDQGGTYLLSRQDADTLITTAVSGQQLSIGMAMVAVRISGAFISWQHATFNAGTAGANIMVNQVIRYIDVDAGPDVVVPSGPPNETAAG